MAKDETTSRVLESLHAEILARKRPLVAEREKLLAAATRIAEIDEELALLADEEAASLAKLAPVRERLKPKEVEGTEEIKP